MTEVQPEIRSNHSNTTIPPWVGDVAAALWSPASRQVVNNVLDPIARQIQAEMNGVLEIPAIRELASCFTHPPRTLDRRLFGEGATDAEVFRRMPLVQQPQLSCCYFSSACSAAAAQNPRAIADMIQENHPDERGVRSYTVTFPFAPNERLTVDDPTHGQPDQPQGNWSQVLLRAYGLYLQRHPEQRRIERACRVAGEGPPSNLEEHTDGGSLFNAGLNMFTNPETHTLTRRLWEVDPDVIRRRVGNDDRVVQAAQFLLGFVTVPRSSQQVHTDLQGWRGQGTPATAYVSGVEHEIAILDYIPGRAVNRPGPEPERNTAGVVVLRDQAGIDFNESIPGARGLWWREPGQDTNTICMRVEDFATHCNGYAFVRRRNR